MAAPERRPRRSVALNVRSVRNTQCPSIKRALDVYHIDDTRKKLSQLNREHWHVLIKRDSSGTPDLTHGAYVSKQGTDAYGEFKWVNPKILMKYQSPEVAVISFTNSDQLTQLTQTYSNAPLPAFLTQTLNGESCRDSDLHRRNEKLAQYVSPIDRAQHGYLIAPNVEHCNEHVLDTYATAPQALKDSKHGIALCTYAIHPDIQSSFLESRCLPSGSVRLEVTENTPQKTLKEAAQVEPLTSILSLNKAHLPQLQILRQETMQHLRDVYAVNEHDNTRMFFHFPVDSVTATLHLHTWVNKGDHPLNECRSFDLDTIIAHLASGKEISTLVLDQNGRTYSVPASSAIKAISGIPLEGVSPNALNLPL
jgi:hypothetical protein